MHNKSCRFSLAEIKLIAVYLQGKACKLLQLAMSWRGSGKAEA